MAAIDDVVVCCVGRADRQRIIVIVVSLSSMIARSLCVLAVLCRRRRDGVMLARRKRAGSSMCVCECLCVCCVSRVHVSRDAAFTRRFGNLKHLFRRRRRIDDVRLGDRPHELAPRLCLRLCGHFTEAECDVRSSAVITSE